MYAYPFLSPVQTFGLLNAHFLVRLYFTINKYKFFCKKCIMDLYNQFKMKVIVHYETKQHVSDDPGWRTWKPSS